MASTETKILADCLGQGLKLTDAAEYPADAIVSKTLLNKAVGTITLFAFDAGQSLSEHTSPYDAVVQVLEGKASLTIGGQQQDVGAGELIVMPANVPHSVDAEEKFKMLLTMIRG